MVYMPVTEANRWKLSVVQELIDVKWGEAVVDGFEDIELDAIIEELCTRLDCLLYIPPPHFT